MHRLPSVGRNVKKHETSLNLLQITQRHIAAITMLVKQRDKQEVEVNLSGPLQLRPMNHNDAGSPMSHQPDICRVTNARTFVNEPGVEKSHGFKPSEN